MRIIAPKRLQEFWKRHPESRSTLNAWVKHVRKANWGSFAELKLSMGARADRYKQFVIFDIGGNNYRLIAAIHFNTGIVFIRHVLTHAEYDLDKWKET